MRLLISAILILSAQPVLGDASVQLRDQVVIRRTSYGVPHILGETEQAAAFGFAWAQCEDHFPLVYKSVVRGRSEVSRWYGASDENVEYDFQTRQLRARATVIGGYHRLPADFRNVVAGFAAGVNAYMSAHPSETLPWMTPVTPHDVATAWEVAVMRFTFLRGNVIGRLRKAASESELAGVETMGEPTRAMGSNTIALAPSRTRSGKAILLNNPHQPWSEEANYYEAHVTVPGVHDFYGSTFAGSPVLTTGFNRNLGWSHTVNHPDLFELYEVQLDPARPDHYRFDASSIPFETEIVTVHAAGDRLLNRTFQWSPLGPVIHKTSDKAYILRSAGYERLQTGPQWYRMSKATSLAEFRHALLMQQVPMFNIAYADRDGNIMYVWNGTVPELPHAAQRYAPVAAHDTEDVWTRIHPLDELMQHVNPRGGYVQNCNSPPYLTNLHVPLNRHAFPHYFPDNNLSLRTQQCLSLIHNERKFSLAELAEVKFSTSMLLADRVKGDLLRLLEEADLDSEQQEAATMLRVWDNTAAVDSVGSVLFKVWWDIYRRSGHDFAAPWQEAAPMSTPHGIAAPARAVSAFKDAMEMMMQRWGSWRVPWGEVHRIRVGKVDLPVGGGDGMLGCLRVCDFKEADDGRLEMSGGDGYVFVVEFGDRPRAYSVLAYGQSRRPGSKHHDDQTTLFANHKMKPVPFTADEIEQQLLRAYRPGD